MRAAFLRQCYTTVCLGANKFTLPVLKNLSVIKSNGWEYAALRLDQHGE